jgi:NAD(P)H-dependent FMN reductase
MKTICRNLHCWVLPQEVSIANSAQTFDDDGTVKDPAIEERLLNVGRQLVKFASVQRKVQQSEFAQLWKSLPTW